MSEKVFNVLFLCTGNAARSVMAELILNRLGHSKFKAYSAGRQPAGFIHPNTLRLLQELGYRTFGLRSKSWREFARPGAPPLDFVFTVCDQAAGEFCSLWPGQPITAHWGVPDPAAVQGSPAVIAAAFAESYRILLRRIELFIALPVSGLDQISLQTKLKEIGEQTFAAMEAANG